MITASAKGGQPRQLAPPGTHIARCYQVIDLGTHQTEWKGKPRKRHEIRISWELPLEKAVFQEDKGEQPFAVHRSYTLSLAEKADLRHDLDNWRGRPFTEQELEGFDVAKILGVACMVTVTHVEKNGSTYANVTSVTAVPKGYPVPAAINPPVEFSLEDHDEAVFRALPEFLQKIIKESDEWKQKGAAPAEDADNIPMGDEDGGEEPEIPF